MTHLQVNNKNGWYECSSCNEPVKPVFWGNSGDWNGFTLKQVDSGLYFKIYGGYGEFFDVREDSNNFEVLLCHTCSVKVMEIIDPKITQIGGHPTINEDGTKCCKWGWVWQDVKDEEKTKK